MDAPARSPMALLRDLTQTIDTTVENVIEAHGFSFSALSADSEGAVMRFTAPAPDPGAAWHLTFSLPSRGKARIALLRGEEQAPSVALALVVGDRAGPAAALAVAMELFATVERE